MSAVHEVLAASGECLYRGRDVELACEIYEASPAGTRLRCHREAPSTPRIELHTSEDEPIAYRLPVVDEPVPYALTEAGYAATDMFVVDTANVAELRRRCPALFARPSATGSADRRPRGRSMP